MINKGQKYAPGSISMLGWALNEEECIGEYIERAEALLNRIAHDYELILIDDGSTDETAAIIRDYQQTRPWLRLHSNERNRGPGYNTKKAIELATKDYLFWQTVDWSYDISLLMDNLHLLEQYDVLQGVRPLIFSLSSRSDNTWKAFVSLVNYMLIKFLFNLPVHDYQNVTVYPRGLIQPVQIDADSPFVNPECLLKVWWKGCTIKEVPVPFLKRDKGEAKGAKLRFIIASSTDIIWHWFKWRILGQRQDKGRGKVVYWESKS